MMASHLPRSLTAARRVMMALPPPRGIMTSQKVSLPLKREAELLALYKDLHTRRKVSLLYLEKGQLPDLSIHDWQNHRRVCPDTLSGYFLQGQLNQNSILVESVRPFGSYVDHRDARPQKKGTHIFQDLDVPITLRKGIWSCTLHSFSNYISYDRLSTTHPAFITNLSSVEIPNNVQEALASPNWKKAVYEEMRALRVMEHGKLQSFQEKRRLWFVGGSLQWSITLMGWLKDTKHC